MSEGAVHIYGAHGGVTVTDLGVEPMDRKKGQYHRVVDGYYKWVRLIYMVHRGGCHRPGGGAYGSTEFG